MEKLKDLIGLAKTTSCKITLEGLSKEPNMLVRRAVARNKFTSSDTLDKLAFDQTLNVSYMAVSNLSCRIDRKFSEDQFGICVACEKDERYMDCYNCFNK